MHRLDSRSMTRQQTCGVCEECKPYRVCVGEDRDATDGAKGCNDARGIER